MTVVGRGVAEEDGEEGEDETREEAAVMGVVEARV